MNAIPLDLRTMARALNGDVEGDQVRCPGPGHSRKDRSLGVKPVSGNPDGFVVNSYCGDPWDVPLRMMAHVLAYDAVKPIAPTSKPGAVSVADLMSGLASQMGLTFENNGVSKTLMNPYLPGTAYQQAQAVVNHARIEWIADCGTLAIWPPGQSRQGTTTISPSTGLVGYPAFNDQGVVLKTLWQPTLTYGSLINVQSDLQQACGTWSIKRLEYELDSLVPHGKWFCTIDASRPGVTVVA